MIKSLAFYKSVIPGDSFISFPHIDKINNMDGYSFKLYTNNGNVIIVNNYIKKSGYCSVEYKIRIHNIIKKSFTVLSICLFIIMLIMNNLSYKKYTIYLLSFFLLSLICSSLIDYFILNKYHKIFIKIINNHKISIKEISKNVFLKEISED